MDLRLSANDQATLTQAFEVFLTPLEHESDEDWHLEILKAISAVLNADKVCMYRWAGGELRVTGLSVRAVDVVSREYVPLALQIGGAQIAVRARKLGVHTDVSLWQPFRDVYEKSAYYNEFIKPLRLHHATGLTLDWDAHRFPYDALQVIAYRDSGEALSFGDRGMSLLRLLSPTIRAGFDIVNRFQFDRSQLLHSLDSTGKPLMFFDGNGGLIHQSPEVDTALQYEPQRDIIKQRAAQLAKRLAARTSLERNGSDYSGSSPVDSRAELEESAFRLRACLIKEQFTKYRPMVLVFLDPLRPGRFNAAALRERFGLTPRESEVAFLLAQRLRAAEIADQLSISANTVRHHTEKIFEKLGVRSRIDVAALLRG